MRGRVLFISNIAWDFIWQRHQTMATLFARDADVLFCEMPGIRRVGWRDVPRILARLQRLGRARRTLPTMEPVPIGIRIVHPFVLPATNALFCALNARLLDRFLAREATLGRGVKLVINYSPARTALQLLDRVPHERLVYDCTDDWLAVCGIPACLPQDERTLLARADLTLVPSRRLEELKRPLARRLERVPHGVLVERFLLDPKPRAADGAVTLLYYGHLHQQHLDFALLDALARARPAWRIVLVGPVRTPHAFPPNVRLAGQQRHEGLRDFVRESDVLLLPYMLNDYTRSVLPAKIFECLATGRPVVAVPLPELTVDFAEHLRFATDGASFAREVEAALATDTAAARERRIAFARANTWQVRYERICELLAGSGGAASTRGR
jgi:glycosyltransferase involved in cell wall biosynthesis